MPHGSTLSQSNVQFQATMLEGVSRTFALTIPRLPEALRHVVSNAYLLCRTIDTIEDEPLLSPDKKQELCNLFLEILDEDKAASLLTDELGPLLSDGTLPAERELIHHLDKVILITRSFHPEQQQALSRCVRIMSEGMIFFQHHAGPHGLKDLTELNKYCYHVAGVVGEMLTDLFCYYSPEINRNREQMKSLCVSFGQGLQMTNILKDIWDDHKRGICWLPRNLFEDKGIYLKDIGMVNGHRDFQQGMQVLIGIAHQHLQNALHYTLLVPEQEKGIREFCLWALGMALLTLKKINRNLGFTDGRQVKISRNSVKATVAITSLTVSSDRILKTLFQLIGKELKHPINGYLITS